MTAAAPLIAVVDDEESVCRALQRLLRSAGFAVTTFRSGSELLASVGVDPPDCVVLDLHMPVMSGLEVQVRLAQAGRRLPVVVITGHDTTESRDRALAAGACAYLRKPINDEMLLDAISRAVGTSGGGKPAGAST